MARKRGQNGGKPCPKTAGNRARQRRENAAETVGIRREKARENSSMVAETVLGKKVVPDKVVAQKVAQKYHCIKWSAGEKIAT